MLVYARSKYILALVVLLLSALYSLPNLYPQDPSVQITPSRGAKVDAAFRQRVDAAL
jgi:preprotein translocase subunit SecD